MTHKKWNCSSHPLQCFYSWIFLLPHVAGTSKLVFWVSIKVLSFKWLLKPVFLRVPEGWGMEPPILPSCWCLLECSGVFMFIIVISFSWTDLYYYKMSLFISSNMFILKSILSDSIATPALLMVAVCVICLYHLFTFNLFISCTLNCVPVESIYLILYFYPGLQVVPFRFFYYCFIHSYLMLLLVQLHLCLSYYILFPFVYYSFTT